MVILGIFMFLHSKIMTNFAPENIFKGKTDNGFRHKLLPESIILYCQKTRKIKKKGKI